MKMEVVIVGAARTPIGSLNGSLSTLLGSELGAIVIKESLKRANLKPEDVSQVIMGQTLTAGEGQNPARQAAMKSNIPFTVPSFTVNQLCGSGLKTVSLGYQSISVGESKIVVCGGQESMSMSPHFVRIRNPLKIGNTSLIDTMLHDGLIDAFDNVHMGITAENVASQENITRVDQDLYSVESQTRVETATKNGYFDDEIVPVEIKTRKGIIIVDKDEFPKPGTTDISLATLKPAFKKDGTVTPGNASGVNDGAAAVVLTTKEEAAKRNLVPLARIVDFAQVGLDPKLMGLGPVPAVQELMKKVGWKLEEVDLFELNEAFAAQSLAVLRGLGLDPAKVNISGGAIALGHPIGASGARILVTLLYGLKRIKGKKGVAALCIGGGMGIAVAIESLCS